MRLSLLSAVFVVAACVVGGMACAAQETPQRNVHYDLSVFSIPQEIPASYALSKSVFRRGSLIIAAANLSASVTTRERERTWYWIEKAISRVPGEMVHKIALVSAINGKDDGAFLSFDLDGYHYSVLDARDLSVLIEKPGLAKLDLVDVAKSIVRYGLHYDLYRTSIVPLETHVIDADRSYGKLPTVLAPYVSWFVKPIEWCRDKDAILFVFQKELDEPASKVPYPAWKVDGGLRYDDERAIRRFVNPNADQLSNEYRDAKPRKILKTNEIIGTISFIRQAQP